jgi:hypothetical protein
VTPQDQANARQYKLLVTEIGMAFESIKKAIGDAALSCAQIANEIHRDTGASFTRNAVIGNGIRSRKSLHQPSVRFWDRQRR